MSGWTPEEDAMLTELWGRKLSSGRIGDILGRTKNAVIGRAHRIKLPSRPSPIRQGRSQSEKAKAAAAKRLARSCAKGRLVALGQAEHLARQDKLLPDGQAAPRLPAVTFTPHVCQWIEGEPSADDACKCGAPALSGSSYCAEHHARCYREPETMGVPDWREVA